MGYSEYQHAAHTGTLGALTRACEEGTCDAACVRACVRVSVHCEPLPSCRDASDFPVAFTLAPHSAPIEAAYLRCAQGTHRWQWCTLSHCCLARACCALSINASPSSASWHDRCRWAARQMLMRTASCGRCVLHDTWHDLHDALRRVQRARPAYAAFSSVSSAICARSSAMPAGSLSIVLSVSTAVPKGEIVPKWAVYG